MFEVRVHGRGGQGVLTAAELLAIAASLEGRHTQAFSRSGWEFAGDPVVAYCRIDDREILSRMPVAHPDALIVLDPTLLDEPGLFDGLSEDGFLLINSGRRIENLDLPVLALRPERRLTVPATELVQHASGGPLPNAALLGGFAALTGVVSLDSMVTAVRQRFPGQVGVANSAVAATAFDVVRVEIKEHLDA